MEEQDTEGLERLKWSMFDCPYQEGTGYRLMERPPVLILDAIAKEQRLRFDVELGYTSPTYADTIGLISSDPHRAGLAVRIRVLNPKKRMQLVKHLILYGVSRIALSRETVYYDMDPLAKHEDWLGLWDLR